MTDLSDYQPKSDLAAAETLPSRWYRDPEIFALERERVFLRTWQWVGRSADLSNPGDYVAGDVLGEPILLVRGADCVLRAFANVCRHRAGPVAEGKGNRKQLQCGYHGWTYGLDGGLRRAPEMEGVRGFETAGIRLPEVRVEEWPPLVFVKLDPSGPSFHETASEIGEEVRRAGFPIETMRLAERREYDVEANWKVYVDNYVEGYHIPMIHPALYREIDYERYRVEARRYHSAQFAPLRASGREESVLYYWVFPNLMLNFYPGSLQVNAVLPLSPTRTRTIFEWYATGGTEEVRDAVVFSEQVQREDMAICAAVQKGLASRSYQRGRFSARRENGVHHFHLLLHEHLTATQTNPAAPPRSRPS
jgi:choline monooxygenase